MAPTQAQQDLRALAAKQENYVRGWGNKPQGRLIPISGSDSIRYGGGVWVVIEQDEQHFWYIQNNPDKDDWNNNVITDVGDAIGYRLALTNEARALIEAAKE